MLPRALPLSERQCACLLPPQVVLLLQTRTLSLYHPQKCLPQIEVAATSTAMRRRVCQCPRASHPALKCQFEFLLHGLQPLQRLGSCRQRLMRQARIRMMRHLSHSKLSQGKVPHAPLPFLRHLLLLLLSSIPLLLRVILTLLVLLSSLQPPSTKTPAKSSAYLHQLHQLLLHPLHHLHQLLLHPLHHLHQLLLHPLTQLQVLSRALEHRLIPAVWQLLLGTAHLMLLQQRILPIVPQLLQ
jgi:hypothetical protein